MFNELTNFSLNRTRKEAFGFYICWLVVMFLTAFLLGSIVGILFPNHNTFEAGLKVGAITAAVYTVTFTVLILKGKNLLSNFSSILLVLVSGLISIFIGGIIGMIIPAYVTTWKEESGHEEVHG